jgi:ATP-dependent Clp protease ATP-binding subunit ClpA
MFDRFTSSALTAIENAQIEARSLGHNYVGTEHVLIALSARPDTTAGSALQEFGIEPAGLRDGLTRRLGSPPPDEATLLRSLGIDLHAVRQTVERTLGPDAVHAARPPRRRRWFRGRRGNCHSILLGEMGVTPRLKRSFELAVQHAGAAGHAQANDGYLLLALLEDRTGLAAELVGEQIGDVALLEESLRHRLAP